MLFWKRTHSTPNPMRNLGQLSLLFQSLQLYDLELVQDLIFE